MKPLSRQAVGKSAATKSRLRRKTVAKNLAIGMKPEEALIEAGYSPTTARKKAYRIIRHPEVQSLLTEAVERVLAEEKKQFDDIVRPYVKALEATVVVKNSQCLRAVETEIPDHAVRMEAAAHLTKLYQPKNVEDDEQAAGNEKPPVLVQVNFIEAGAKPPDSPVLVNPQPSTAPKGAPPSGAEGVIQSWSTLLVV